MTDSLYPVPEQAKQGSHLNAELHQAMYKQSIESPDAFWKEQSKILDWVK